MLSVCFIKTQKGCDGGWKLIWSIWRHYWSPAGRCLAPFLFVVLVDYLLKRATAQLDSGVVTHPRRSRWHPAHRLAWILNLTSTGPALKNSRSSTSPWPCHQCTKDSMWLWIATHSQPFKSMEIQSTMYQILDTLVPWWHLAQVTSKGESHFLGVRSAS